jgi:hypothetical protein
MLSRSCLVGALAALVVSLVVGGATARAREKPFHIVGAGIGPVGLPLPGQDPQPHWAIGEATHLGKYSGEGSVRTNTATFNPDNGHFTGEFESGEPFVFEGANGDVLACDYGHVADNPGTFELVPTAEPGVYVAFWVAEFVPVDSLCTGKFKGVTGSWTMYAMSAPFVLGSEDPIAYVWEGRGKLNFARKK